MAALSLTPGSSLGRYRVLELIESHSRYALLLCEQLAMKRTVIVWLLTETRPQQVARFHKAAELLGRLRHPHIHAPHDLDEHDGHPFLVLEHIEGASNAAGPLTRAAMMPTVALRIAGDIATALHHAHANDVIHRRVAPDAILLTPDGRAVLTNFLNAATRAGDPLVELGTVEGVPQYMAPEQWSGATVGRATDIWGLGVTLWEMVVGSALYPWDGDPGTVVDLARRIRDHPVDLTAPRGLDPRVVEVIDRCLQREPAARFASARDLAEAVEQVAAQLEVPQSTPFALTLPAVKRTLVLRADRTLVEEEGPYDEFEILEFLGGGGYGQVFRARERRSGTVVALKILKRQWIDSPAGVVRFQREAALLARVRHRAVVRLHSFGRYLDSCYVAMQMVEGETLESRLAAQSPLPVAQAEHIARSLLEGLVAVHEVGAVHRDVKPANIMLVDADDPAAAGPSVVLIDFGVATARDAQTLTQTGVRVGTPAYMSPEQAMGERATEKVDVYAVGAVLFEMLSGKPPFKGTAMPALLTRIALEQPPRLATLRPDLPDALCNLVDRLLAKAPAERPSASVALGLLVDTVSTRQANDPPQ